MEQPTPQETARAIVTAIGQGDDVVDVVGGLLLDVLEGADDQIHYLARVLAVVAGTAAALADYIASRGDMTRGEVLDSVTVDFDDNAPE